MAVNPLDPTKPVLGDLVEVDEELRAIKGRLVTDRDDISNLKTNTTNLLDKDVAITALGRALDRVVDGNAAQNLIGGKTAGKGVFTKESVNEILTFLGIANLAPNITSGSVVGGTGFTITMPPLMINVLNISVPGGGTNFTFLNAFPQECIAVTAVNVNATNDFPKFDSIPTKVGGRIDHNGGATKNFSIIALGR